MGLLGYANHRLNGVPFPFILPVEKIVQPEPACSPTDECQATSLVFIQSFHIHFYTCALFRCSISKLPEQRNLEAQCRIWPEAVAGANGWLHAIPVHAVPVSVTLSFRHSWTSLDKLLQEDGYSLQTASETCEMSRCTGSLLCCLLLGPSFPHTKKLCCPVTSSDHISDTKHNQDLGSGACIFGVD